MREIVKTQHIYIRHSTFTTHHSHSHAQTPSQRHHHATPHDATRHHAIFEPMRTWTFGDTNNNGWAELLYNYTLFSLKLHSLQMNTFKLSAPNLQTACDNRLVLQPRKHRVSYNRTLERNLRRQTPKTLVLVSLRACRCQQSYLICRRLCPSLALAHMNAVIFPHSCGMNPRRKQRLGCYCHRRSSSQDQHRRARKEYVSGCVHVCTWSERRQMKTEREEEKRTEE